MPLAYSISNLALSASSKPEAFGRISVAAQSMEIPIIASNLGGSKETLIDNKTGFLFKNNDAKALADLLQKVMFMDRNTLKSIGLEGRKNILKKFDVEKMCNSTFTEYKKLIN